jgi:outer membrane lipoprotein SlyB
MWTEKTKFALLGASIAALTACGTTGNSNTASTQTIPVTTTTTTSSATGYGVVQAIDVVQRDPATGGIGLGTVAGAVVGGVLGNQVGSGRGQTAATVAGAAGGAMVGNKMEQNSRSADQAYRVAVRMDNGSIQTLVQDTPPSLQVGERVRLANGAVVERFR